MARDKNRPGKQKRAGRTNDLRETNERYERMPSDNDRNNRRSKGGESAPKSDASVRAIKVLDEILESTDPLDANYQYLLLLRHQLEIDEQQLTEAQEMIQKYDEAYTKLTAPAKPRGGLPLRQRGRHREHRPRRQ